MEADGSIDGIAVESGTGAAIPTRLIVVTSHFGFWNEAFMLRFESETPLPATETTVRDLTGPGVEWSRILAPLEGLKQHVTVVSGLAMHTSFDARASGGDDAKTALTGQVVSVGGAVGPSIDWLIGQANAPAGGIPVVVAGTEEYSFDSSKSLVRAMREPRDIHAQLFGPGTSGKCTSPVPSAYGELVAQSNQRYRGWMMRMIPLISDAFVCDRTRVFSLHGPDPSPAELGSGAQNLDQDVNDRVRVDPASVEVMIRYSELFGKQLSDLANELNSKPAGDGTLLDHTLIVWLPGWAEPGHGRFPWNMVLIGGRSLGLKTGRDIRVVQNTTFSPYNKPSEMLTTGGAHNKALNSITAMFGVGSGHVGDESITLRNGNTLDLRGSVDQLF
ncbi:MAG: DUF1552 domain-containing protein [Deltaproteobacteria bacterium]|nr:DUF1552 domain-containing protein [Deltaproteobacteria bacterium]